MYVECILFVCFCLCPEYVLALVYEGQRRTNYSTGLLYVSDYSRAQKVFTVDHNSFFSFSFYHCLFHFISFPKGNTRHACWNVGSTLGLATDLLNVDITFILIVRYLFSLLFHFYFAFILEHYVLPWHSFEKRKIHFVLFQIRL